MSLWQAMNRITQMLIILLISVPRIISFRYTQKISVSIISSEIKALTCCSPPAGGRAAPTRLSITHIVCSWRGMDVGPYPTERDGPTPVGTSVARGGADGPRRECLDRSRDRRMPVRRRAAGPTVACAARPDGGRDGREHPARLPGLGQHQGGLPLLLQ